MSFLAIPFALVVAWLVISLLNLIDDKLERIARALEKLAK